MTRSYRTLGEIDPNLFADIIKGSSQFQEAADDDPAQRRGLMLPTSRYNTSAQEGLQRYVDENSADQNSLANSVLADVARRMSEYATDRERLAEAVATPPKYDFDTMGDPAFDLDNLPPIEELLGRRDQTREALGEPDPVNVEQSTQGAGIEMVPANGEPVEDVDVQTQKEAATSLEQQANQEDFVPTFVDWLGENLEGTEDHTDSGGLFTYAYGILPSTANDLGIDVEEYSSRRDAAIRVYDKMNNKARDTYPSVFEGLNNEQANGVLALYINLGSLPNSVETALSGDEKDFEAAGQGLSRNILYRPRDDQGNDILDEEGNTLFYASKGVSARRAREYNLLRADDPDFTPVDRVTVTGTKENPTFNWLSESGEILITHTPGRALSPDNDMSEVGL